MKKTILCCVFLLLPVLAFAQPAESISGKVTMRDNVSSLLDVLETDLGEKMIDGIADQGGTIAYDEATSLSASNINFVTAPIESATDEWKRLAYVKIFNGKEFLLIIERNNGTLNFHFPSGRTVVVGGSQKLIEMAHSGMVFQEYDDVDNTIHINQRWPRMFWMYIWMFLMMPFMGPMM